MQFKVLLNQDYKNTELIIINDGSDEESYYNYQFPNNVKIIHLEENQKNIHGFGPGSIRNFGTNVARRRLFSFS